MINKILFATDYSEASLNALETAIFIAVKNNALLQLLHIVETDAGIRPDMKAQGQAWQVTEAMASSIKQKHAIKVDVIFRNGFAGPAIVKTATTAQADLIVLGKNGASGKRALFAGSTAYYTVKNANCPVLVIPEDERYISFEQILFPVRTSFGLSKKYEFIRSLNIAMGTRIDVVAFSMEKELVNHEAPGSLSVKMNDNSTSDGMKIIVNASSERNISREVLELANHFNSTLIILSAAIDVITKQFFIGPFCQQIIHYAQVPVLYFR